MRFRLRGDRDLVEEKKDAAKLQERDAEEQLLGMTIDRGHSEAAKQIATANMEASTSDSEGSDGDMPEAISAKKRRRMQEERERQRVTSEEKRRKKELVQMDRWAAGWKAPLTGAAPTSLRSRSTRSWRGGRQLGSCGTSTS